MRRFSCAAAVMNKAAVTSVNQPTKARESRPAGMARICVRGLTASRSASAQRLKAMAELRASTMQATIQKSCRAAGPAPGREHRAGEGEGQGKDRVLPLDHFERGAGLLQELHRCDRPLFHGTW